MAACLTLSIGSAVIALRSRMHRPSKLKRELEERGVAPHDGATYKPAFTWFFQHLANLKPDALAGALARADATFAIQSLAHNLVPLAENVVRKHRWVNRGSSSPGQFSCSSSRRRSRTSRGSRRPRQSRLQQEAPGPDAAGEQRGGADRVGGGLGRARAVRQVRAARARAAPACG